MSAADAATGREISDEKVRAATGRTWDEWEALLDSRGAADLPHQGIVALLEDGLIASGWWVQMVAVGYARRKGTRVLGQTSSGDFQVGVRRTLPLAPDAAWRLVTSAEGVRAWLGDAPDLALAKGATYATPDGAKGEVRVLDPGSHLRITWQPSGWARASTIQVRVIPAGERTTLSFHEERLPSAAERAERRRHFEAALDALQRLAGTASPENA
ncbi:MAG TPA: SRPBCC domain-containing protein [Longimicrobiaceae bacterium]|nr:SRPBCC domain-containing protein [Longimicrobiaceae bacterium]